MGSKAIHQLPLVTDEHESDVLYGTRALGGGLYEDFSVLRKDVGYITRPATAFLTSAQVLSLNTTPVVILTGVPDKIIIPKLVILTLTGATVDYATNTLALVGSSATIDDTHFTLNGGLPQTTNAIALFPGFTVTGQVSSVIAGDDLAISVKTGNPTAGDGDMIVILYYELVDA